ncbi:hypothetical protein [Sorangium cellulosum]|nr:hypothetical protein [Sorangium cellulosum]
MMMSSGCHEIWLDPIQGGTWGDTPDPTAPDETEDDVEEPEDDTLEIVSSDETSLLVRLSGVGDQHWPIDGEHTVPLCGT